MQLGLEEMVRQLWARDQIRDCVMRWSRGCDRCDEETIRSAYHSDGVDDHGVFKGPIDEFAPWAMKVHTEICTNGTAHNITNHLVEFDPENSNIAFAETYCIGWLRTDTQDMISQARYLDRLECRDGAWRIAHRKSILDWQRVDPLGASSELVNGITVGHRSTDDESYRLLPSERVRFTGAEDTVSRVA